jgi:hypothetical protein
MLVYPLLRVARNRGLCSLSQDPGCEHVLGWGPSVRCIGI